MQEPEVEREEVKASARERNSRSEQVERGIRIKAGGYEGYAKHFGQNRAKRFTLDTDLQVIREWRDSVFVKSITQPTWKRRHWPSGLHLLTRDQGYCYIYFIRARNRIKIGRAVEPRRRFTSLQAGSSEKLIFLGAIPAHKTLEALLHDRFAAHRVHSEWFNASHELLNFIEQVVDYGKNPLLLLWASDQKWPRLSPLPDDAPSGNGDI